MIEFMAQEEVRQADVVVVQEPWRNPFTDKGYNPSGGPFRLIDAGTKTTRTSIYLSRRFSSDRVKVIQVQPDSSLS